MFCCKAMSCCKDKKFKKRLLCGGICFIGALLCWASIGPIYQATLATPTGTFIDCMKCGADYATYVVNNVNGGAIVDKIIAEHDYHDFHRGGHHHRHRHHHHHHADVCITGDDLKALNFEDLDVEPVPQACIELCAPVAKRVGLAAACAGAAAICALALLLCALGTFLRACCCLLWKKRAASGKVVGVPAEAQGAVGTYTNAAATMKTPLLEDAPAH